MGSPTRRSAQGFPVPLGDAIEDAISLSTLTNIIMMLNPAGEVSWAFPVTVEETPHQLRFGTGEYTFAA